MEKVEFDALVKQVGEGAASEISKLMNEYKAKVSETAQEIVKQGGYLTETQFNAHKEAADKLLEKLDTAAKEQGKTINELMETVKAGDGAGSKKSIADVLLEQKNQLADVYNKGYGTVEFLLQPKANGAGFTMRKLDRTVKAAGVTGTVDGLGSGVLASVDQDLLSSTLLRLGGNAAVVSNFRNTPWLFDLVNVINAEYVSASPFAMWYEETAKLGSAALVAEGATKPTVQYNYKLRSAEYKKVAQLVTFTEEFSIDFRRLQDDIMNKGRIDVLNAVNSAILTDLIAAATPYNTAASFVSGDGVEFVNDFDVIAAMAAQVDNATYGNLANAALMSTFKKYRMGISKAETGEYLNRPDVLSNIAFVGNPDMGANDVVVGDLRNFNVILRGGVIIKIGYNGTDFAENKFSVVMEQYYYDYISDIRKTAIVKGATFAIVKNAIGSLANS